MIFPVPRLNGFSPFQLRRYAFAAHAGSLAYAKTGSIVAANAAFDAAHDRATKLKQRTT